MNVNLKTDFSCVEQIDRLPIAVRAFALPPGEPIEERSARQRRSKPVAPSEWTLIFDTETTVDAAQRLKIGSYQLRKADELDEAGLFHDPTALSAGELDLLKRYASANGLMLRTVTEFIDEILYDRAYDLRVRIREAPAWMLSELRRDGEWLIRRR